MASSLQSPLRDRQKAVSIRRNKRLVDGRSANIEILQPLEQAMRRVFGVPLLSLFALAIAAIAVAPQALNAQGKASGVETDITKIKASLVGEWVSIAPEVRPSASKNADGTLKPFYLKRTFKYQPSDRFELEIVNSADPYGAVPLARIKIGGHMIWQGSHPIASGAQKVDFVADESYEATPRLLWTFA